MEKENILIHKEKPYYTEDERKLYYQIAIDEAMNQGNRELAAHYQILLDYLDNKDKSQNQVYEMIVNNSKKK